MKLPVTSEALHRPVMDGFASMRSAMRPPLFRWLVLFFTRPIHLSDFAVTWRLPRSKKKDDVEPDTVPGGALAKPRRSDPEAGAARTSRLPPDAVAAEVDVSEQPLDTLPADLQEELLREPSRAGPVATSTPAAGKIGD